MIQSARPAVSPVAIIVFSVVLFCFVWKSWDGHMDGRTTCAKTMMPTGCGLAEWIKYVPCFKVKKKEIEEFSS